MHTCATRLGFLDPFIIWVRLEHPYNILIEDGVLESPIVNRPPFTPQHDTGPEIKVSII